MCLDGWSRILHVTAQFKQMAPAVANAIGFHLLPGVTLIVFLYHNKIINGSFIKQTALITWPIYIDHDWTWKKKIGDGQNEMIGKL